MQSIAVDIHNGDGVTIDADIAELPNAVGFGNAYALHDAMQRDASGDLQALVESFVNETDHVQRHELVEQILITWAGQNGVELGSRGHAVNAQHLGVLETFWGQPALQANPTGRYANSVNNSYNDLSEYVYTQLVMQTHYQHIWQAMTINKDNDGTVSADFNNIPAWISVKVAIGDMTAEQITDIKAAIAGIAGIVPDNSTLEQAFKAAIEEKAKEMPESIKETMREGVRDGNDTLYASDDEPRVVAGAGNDTVHGSVNDDELLGQSGNDTLNGNEWNNRLIGGKKTYSMYFATNDFNIPLHHYFLAANEAFSG